MEIFDKGVWFYYVASTQMSLAIGNFAAAGVLYWIYYRSPVLREYWGPAGVASFMFGNVFAAKGIERVLMTAALFNEDLWPWAAVTDGIVGLFLWLSVGMLILAARHPKGAMQLLYERVQREKHES